MVATAVREQAAGAAAEIRRRGWYQGYYYPREDDTAELESCPVCVLGAVSVVVFGTPDPGVDRNIHHVPLVQELRVRVEDKEFYSASEWNDDPETTVDDVLALLDAIAAGQ